ncbi:hypothetical protein [Nonomuraea pusilla]|uniref:Uncharacterized protein n=1 Tax=Nonomuraea pusilla TaxID=46177 RepID=A0A1H7LHI0_9ACTN|nr:hypothetical protein [Nonomuraea pusilla]SEK98402.1 hypothetical protein SAMN05660976_01580 [Nonomuraea pusilla]
MGLVTAATGTFAALVGVYLMARWLAGGGLRRQAAKVTRFPRTLIIAHPAVALSSLGCWTAHLVTGCTPLAWAAFGGVSAAALLGFAMSTRWLGSGRHERGARGVPRLALALHAAAGVATFVLVLLGAGAGRVL